MMMTTTTTTRNRRHEKQENDKLNCAIWLFNYSDNWLWEWGWLHRRALYWKKTRGKEKEKERNWCCSRGTTKRHQRIDLSKSSEHLTDTDDQSVELQINLDAWQMGPSLSLLHVFLFSLCPHILGSFVEACHFSSAQARISCLYLMQRSE